jgi:ribosomal protein S18 acetylase RimI-like enzyme
VDESDAVAAVFRVSKEAALPCLPDLHTAAEDQRYFREHVFASCEVWVVTENDAIVGFCAFREGWVDQLYVDPSRQGRGIGSALLRKATDGQVYVRLWTFQRNRHALAFYTARGFRVVEKTDGRGNEEREPDVLLAWGDPL